MSPPSPASYPAGVSGPGGPPGKLPPPHLASDADQRHAREYGNTARYSGYPPAPAPAHYPHNHPLQQAPPQPAPGSHSPFPSLHSPALSVSSLDPHPHSQSNSPHPARRPLPRSSLESSSTYSGPYYPDPMPPSAAHAHGYPPDYPPQYPHAHPQDYPPHAHGPHRTVSPRSAPTYPYPPRPGSGYDRSEPLGHAHAPPAGYAPPHPAGYAPPHQPPYAVPSMGMGHPPGQMGGGPPGGMPTQQYLPVVHTDDATTKLSDRVRRRCFNCCTTDTSTWRRSNLSPGKVVRVPPPSLPPL